MCRQGIGKSILFYVCPGHYLPGGMQLKILEQLSRLMRRRPGMRCLMAAAVVVLIQSFTEAAYIKWTGASGDWSDASHWGGTEPTSTDGADIENGSTVYITQTGEQCSSLYLGGTNNTSAGTINMINGSLTVSGSAIIGENGTGTFNQTGGTNTITQDLNLAEVSGLAIYNLSSNGNLFASHEHIGSGGTAVFTQTDSTNTTQLIVIGKKGTYTLNGGTLNINGGVLNSGIWDLSNSSTTINLSASILNLTENISNTGNATLSLDSHSLLIVPSGYDPVQHFAHYSNTGYFHQAGSTLNISSTDIIYGAGNVTDHVDCQGILSATPNCPINLRDGINVLESGSINLGYGELYINDTISGINSGTLKASVLYVGETNNGTFTQIGGTNTISYLSLGYDPYKPSFTSTYILSGSGQLSAGEEHIGNGGTGYFTQSSGINNITRDLYLGYTPGSISTYTLSGNGILNAQNEFVSSSGSGIFTQTGGTNTISRFLYIGYSPYEPESEFAGTYNLSDSGVLIANIEVIPNGVFKQTGGINTITQSLMLGPTQTFRWNNSGTYDLSGTGELYAGPEQIGWTGTALFTQSGGLNSTSYISIEPLGQYKFSGGTITGNNLRLTLDGQFLFTGGTLILKSLTSYSSIPSNFQFGGGTLQASGDLSTTVPMTMTGVNGNANINTSGYAVTLAGALSGPGGLNKLGSGMLILSAGNSYYGKTDVNAGTLAVNGSLNSGGLVVVNNGGILGGTGSVGNVMVNSGGHIAPGNSAGVLRLAGGLTLNSGALLDFDLANTAASDKISMTGSTLYLNGQQFADFTFTVLSGFGSGTYILIDAGGIQGSLGNNISGDIGGLSVSLSMSGNDLVLNVVPEPSIWILLATFGVGLFAYTRRRW